MATRSPWAASSSSFTSGTAERAPIGAARPAYLGRARATIYELTGEAAIFLLRVLLLGLLYLFLLVVVGAIRRDVGRAGADEERTASTARLTVLDPGRTRLAPGAALALQPLTRLGRSGRNTIVLDDAYVSSEHAVIAYRDGKWWLADQHSMNGTFLNDRPVDGEVALSPGDDVGIGDIRLRFAP
jgi:hypothetical protein